MKYRIYKFVLALALLVSSGTSQALAFSITPWATTGSYPIGITIDPAGNLYTVNGNDNTVTKITPAGVSSILGTTGDGRACRDRGIIG